MALTTSCSDAQRSSDGHGSSSTGNPFPAGSGTSVSDSGGFTGTGATSGLGGSAEATVASAATSAGGAGNVIGATISGGAAGGSTSSVNSTGGSASTTSNLASASASSSSGGVTPGGAITISGRQILVNGQPLHLRGVNWNPVPAGETHPDGLAYAQFASQDIALMSAAGINAVRTYEPLTDISVLDALASAGIFVLNTVYAYGGNAASSVDAHVNAVKAHPAILLWVIGNEWNYNGLYVDLAVSESIQLIDEVAGRIRQLDSTHPIATVYGELPDSSVLSQLGSIDVWGLNVYSGLSFGDRFSEWALRSDRPMFFGEYGADAWNATTGAYDPESQAIATRELTNEIIDNSTLSGGVCSGGAIFEFADEWWKDQNGSPSSQDVGGVAPGGGPYPDSTFNEEYWGIVTIERAPRPAYDVLQELYTR